MEICSHEIRVRGKAIRIAQLEAEKYHFLDDPEPVLKGLRECGFRIDIFTFLQRLPKAPPKFNFPVEWDNLAVLPVSTFEHWKTQQIRFAPRGRLKQAEKKGVTTREMPFDDALVKGIWEVYNECPIRQGRPFAHYGEDLQTVRQIEATFLDTSVFIGAFWSGQLIGFAKLVADKSWQQANLMNIASMVQHREKCPTNALIAQAVRTCADRGIRYLVYQNFAYTNKEQDSVAKFKEVNGFERVDLPRYYVPLTTLGAVALRAGLHRRWTDHLPASMATLLRRLRTSWYTRKIATSTDAS